MALAEAIGDAPAGFRNELHVALELQDVAGSDDVVVRHRSLITGNTTDMMNTSTNTASVGRRVRRSRPNNRSSAGTHPSSGSNLGAEAAQDASAPGSGISAQPFYPLRRRPNGAAVRIAG